MRWELCIDESGDLSNRSSDVCILGVLVDAGGVGESAQDRLRQSLQAEFPWFRWPLHGRIVRDAAANLVRVRREAALAETHAAGKDLLRIARTLRPAEVRGWDAVDRAFERGKEPSLDQVRDLRFGMLDGPHGPALMEARGILAGHWQRALRRAKTCLEGLGAAQFLLPVAAMELEGPEGGQDRYLDLLVHVVRRAADVLLARGAAARQVLQVSPLQRHVQHPVLGVPAHMDHQLLDSVLRRVGGEEREVRSGDRTLLLERGALLDFHQKDLGAAWVLADFLAADALNAGRARNWTWPGVAGRFRRDTTFALELDDTGLPNMASTGTASTLFGTEAGVGSADVAGADVHAGWPHEQAARWRAWYAEEEGA